MKIADDSVLRTDSTPQIDKEKLESVQRINSLLTLIAKLMVAQDLRTKEAFKEKVKDEQLDGKTSNKPDQV